MADMRIPVAEYLEQRLGVEYYNLARENLFRDPTLNNAKAFLREPPDGWSDPTLPLAYVHKARLQWLDATDDMIAWSLQWLEDYGYSNRFRETFPLTPETRDIERAAQGKAPLAGLKSSIGVK